MSTDHTAPALELDWEEGLFKLVRRLVRRWRPNADAAPAHAAPLAPLAKRLEILASVVAERPVNVVAAGDARGLRGDDLLLPEYEATLPTVEANAELYLLSTLVLATWRGQAPTTPSDAHARAAASMTGFAAAIRAAAEAWPGFEARWRHAAAEALATRPPIERLPRGQRALEQVRQDILHARPLGDAAALGKALRGAPMDAPFPLIGRLFEHPDAEAGAGSDSSGPSKGTEREAPKAIKDVRRAELEEDPEHHNPIVHTFEKVETLDSHEGGSRLADGSDELDAQLEALEEVDLSEVVRGGPPAHALLKADVGIEAEIPDVERIEPSETGLTYDEWDARARRYRRGWCTVYPTAVRAQDPAYAQDVLRTHRRKIEMLFDRLVAHRSKLRTERRQLDGEDVDLDAAIEATAELAAGRESAGRIYVRKNRRARDVATAVLVDVSLSSDAWVMDRRVLDVAKHAVIVLGEVAHRLGDRLAVYGFASKTRNACRVFEVGDFDTPWPRARSRIGALTPQGYTRIGPAIRHVTAQLAAQDARQRLLLVISDGKPTDYDRYEGRYGRGDIRMSLTEASRLGVVAHALTIDAAARRPLSATFGPGAWHVLHDPAALPAALTEVYGRLTTR